MAKWQQQERLFSRRTSSLLGIWFYIGLILVGSVLTTIWILRLTAAPAASPALSPIYVSYSLDNQAYIRPESLAAAQAYIKQHPQPQRAEVLKGLSTAQITTYMINQVSGGLKVDCGYCHNLANGNFAAQDRLPVSAHQDLERKTIAREHMKMTATLNREWIKPLIARVGGRQVTCATCHNGQPVFHTYPDDQSPLPRDYSLSRALMDLDVLQVTGMQRPDLDRVQYNQNTMYHMNRSLGVGCTFCHNARNFASNELPDKEHALWMLKMTRALNAEYKPIMANQTPSCWMCHRGAVVPPGAAFTPAEVPAVLSSNPTNP